jgi:hypothetical protein
VKQKITTGKDCKNKKKEHFVRRFNAGIVSATHITEKIIEVVWKRSAYKKGIS